MTNAANRAVLRTLVIPVRGDQVLLGRKKQHRDGAFGVGKWNGFGGKLEPGETLEQAAIRECQEESGITPLHLEKVAELDFVDDYQIFGHVYLCRQWTGEPVETAEMLPAWFNKTDLPLTEMWDDDIFWLPAVLTGKRVKASFTFHHVDDSLGTGANPVAKVSIQVVSQFD
ncbi:MAG: 8-oxo-dGTP diphosphatase [Cellulomonadaceae bacterium]|jgi:8-oxo-dGTP diphosphatase|nr:8-oxo-dGTP diphosphatase [Cellulomonadaceae bacterium]